MEEELVLDHYPQSNQLIVFVLFVLFVLFVMMISLLILFSHV